MTRTERGIRGSLASLLCQAAIRCQPHPDSAIRRADLQPLACGGRVTTRALPGLRDRRHERVQQNRQDGNPAAQGVLAAQRLHGVHEPINPCL